MRSPGRHRPRGPPGTRRLGRAVISTAPEKITAREAAIHSQLRLPPSSKAEARPIPITDTTATRPSPMTEPTERLIARWAPDSDRLALFLNARATTDVLMRLRRRHAYPVNEPIQDGLVASNVERIRRATPVLSEGDVLFVHQEVPLGRKNDLLRLLLSDVCARFDCQSLGKDGEVMALRLAPRSAATAGEASPR